jgi:hypothetical protein
MALSRWRGRSIIKIAPRTGINRIMLSIGNPNKSIHLLNPWP